uniref:Uncharacterized protein n=1 Tax=Arundo donax TaxID=35708 RepID=A0A0A9DUJ9_ARUDO
MPPSPALPPSPSCPSPACARARTGRRRHRNLCHCDSIRALLCPIPRTADLIAQSPLAFHLPRDAQMASAIHGRELRPRCSSPSSSAYKEHPEHQSSVPHPHPCLLLASLCPNRRHDRRSSPTPAQPSPTADLHLRCAPHRFFVSRAP